MAISHSLIDESPQTVPYRRLMVQGHWLLGLLLLHRGNLGDAHTESRLAAEQMQILVSENPGSMTFRNSLPFFLASFSDSLRVLGRLDEANLIHEQLVKRAEPNAFEHPTEPEYVDRLVAALWRRGITRRERGELQGGADDIRRSLALCESLPPYNMQYHLDKSCALAALASLAGRPGTGVSASEGKKAADRAMHWLSVAVSHGYHDFGELRYESALDPLRSRDDFRRLMIHLAFPAEPFANAE
jgi:hypothetical protein